MNPRIVIKELNIKALANRKRKIRIILPKDYYESKKSYPVLYMHDGQNIIDKSHLSGYSWEVLKTLDELHNLTNGLIIVGIDNDDLKRVLEYSPFIPKRRYNYLHKKLNIPLNEIRPEADFYGEFIVNQLKPLIDKEYRTLPDLSNTFIAGSSCGGIISIYLGFKYQAVFSVIGSFSTAFDFIGKNTKSYVSTIDINSDIKIYHDMGTKEWGVFSFSYVIKAKKLTKLLQEKMPESNIFMKIDKGAKHNEYYWSIRFKEFIHFLFKK
jgi:predicted alpha/beta superfamily hydrolase